MLRTAIPATIVLTIGAAVVLGASQRRGANQPGQPDFKTGTVAVTIANEPRCTIANEPTVMA